MQGWTPEQIKAWQAYYAQYYGQFPGYGPFSGPVAAYPPQMYKAMGAKAVAAAMAVTKPVKTEENLVEEPKVEEPKAPEQKKAAKAEGGGLQWEEVTEDSLYSTSYRPASPEHGSSTKETAEKKRKRDHREYDGIDQNDEEDGDLDSSSKRLKPSGTTYEDAADDDEGSHLIWKKRDPSKSESKRNIRKRTL
jgi:NACalpha-BTF3-like transcription factor